MKEDKNTFKIINDNGEEIICDVLFTFDSEETKKSYIVYTDNSKDEQGNIQVYASIYDPKQIELSDAIGFGLFAYKGTKAVTPDLIIYNGTVASL